ncbi:DNA polymerase III subunit chi [Mangrovicoccus algicola]|uniref:DNA polymerase III subunit chi n=1 Tax=Mangrovicoccus algicola TaxID=2771008 RepID=A0A8J6YU65_9RHOB|nr:DNA polymerase III subunit chi [Mangrovicoccus algicola]MBE3637765.1 DNA polymerase III subunit chi [Mangrovicoccus algicola]
MGRAMFYQLGGISLEATLPRLLERALDAGWKVDLRGRDAARLERLDAALWLGPEAGFLPHGLEGGAHDARQPVLLTTAATARPDAACVMAIDSAEIDPAEAAVLERVCILFDGQDQMQLTAARGQWRALTSAGVVAEYWAEEDGRWQKRMSTADRG